LIPYENLALILSTQEKIGDVCFHTIWAPEDDSKIGIIPHVQPLIKRGFVCTVEPKIEAENKFEEDGSYAHVCESISKLFRRPPCLVLVANKETRKTSAVKTQNDTDAEVIAALNAVLGVAVAKLSKLMMNEGTPLGEIEGVIIGREGARNRTGRGGSIVSVRLDADDKFDCLIAAEEHLGPILYITREVVRPNWAHLLLDGESIEGLTGRIDHSSVQVCMDACYGPPLRAFDILQLTYDAEKLSWTEKGAHPFVIDPIETPDVTGALLEAGSDVVSHIPQFLGDLRYVAISAGVESRETVFAGYINRNVAYLAISKDIPTEIRKTLDVWLPKFSSAFGFSYQAVANNRERLSLELPSLAALPTHLYRESVSRPFLVLREHLNLKVTPLGVARTEYIFKPSGHEDHMADAIRDLQGAITYLIDRARIFVQFILRHGMELRPWTVTLVGTEGAIHCEIWGVGDEYFAFVGGAEGWDVDAITGWVAYCRNRHEEEELTDTEEESLQKRLRRIAKQVENGQCVFLIGHGMSVEAGLPSTEQLAKVLLEDLAGYTGKEPLSDIAQTYVEKFGKADLVKELGRKLKTTLPPEKWQAHKLLAGLPINLLITTNFDSLLEDILSRTGEAVQVISEEQNIAVLSPDQLKVLKIYGSLPSLQIVITRDDHEQYEANFPKFTAWLRQTAQQNTLVFVGYDPTDPDFRLLDAKIRGPQAKYPHKSYLVWGARVARDQEVAWDHKGIEIIQLSPRAFFPRLNLQIQAPGADYLIAAPL
jgi:hypothetical protein